MFGLGLCILVGTMMIYAGCDSIAKELYKMNQKREEGK